MPANLPQEMRIPALISTSPTPARDVVASQNERTLLRAKQNVKAFILRFIIPYCAVVMYICNY
jgi:hypothetical protein